MNGEEILEYKKENKIAICSMYDESYTELADITVKENKVPYCKKHGYNFHVKTSEFEYDMGFSKIKFILDLMEENEYEWFYWCGTDTMIMNQSIRLEDIIDDDYHFIIAKVGGPSLNADSFLIKNSKEGKELFEFILSLREEYKNDCWLEQRVMIDYCEKDPWVNYIKIVEPRTFNSLIWDTYGDPNRNPATEPDEYQKGDFLIHLAGHNLEFRLKKFKELSSQVSY